jgi:hypothetical protein
MSAEAIDADELSKLFNYFHISEQKLSKDDFFTFTPRRPRYPYVDPENNVSEDDFTQRISVAPTVQDALEALGEGSLENVGGWGHLYAGIDHPDAEARTEDCPETDDMEYGLDFLMSKWLTAQVEEGELDPKDEKDIRRWLTTKNRTLRPRILPDDLKDEFEGCVPDADETREQWLLEPTKLIYLGEVEADTGDVLLSTAGLKAVKQAGLKTHSY